MELSLHWDERSRKAFEEFGGQKKGQGLFGIVQGGDIPELRIGSAKFLKEIPLVGYSNGGLAVGEPQETILKMIEVPAPLPLTEKPRYLMGVVTPSDANLLS